MRRRKRRRYAARRRALSRAQSLEEEQQEEEDLRQALAESLVTAGLELEGAEVEGALARHAEAGPMRNRVGTMGARIRRTSVWQFESEFASERSWQERHVSGREAAATTEAEEQDEAWRERFELFADWSEGLVEMAAAAAAPSGDKGSQRSAD